MKTIQDIQTEIKSLIDRLDEIYMDLQYELRFNGGYKRNHCYIRSLENKLTFGEYRLDELRELLRKNYAMNLVNRFPNVLPRKPYKLSIPNQYHHRSMT